MLVREAPSDDLVISHEVAQSPSPEMLRLADRLLFPDSTEMQPSALERVQSFILAHVGGEGTQAEAPPLERETRHGVRTYGMVCVAMIDPDSEQMLIVRKDPFLDHRCSSDWLVATHGIATGESREEEVIQVTVTDHPDGDAVSMLLAVPNDRRFMNRGPFELSFSVDPNYAPDGNPATLTHQNYYGRCIAVDATFTEPVSILGGALDRALETGPRITTATQEAIGHASLIL